MCETIQNGYGGAGIVWENPQKKKMVTFFVGVEIGST